MLNDECGNKLYYDTFGRLQQVLDAAGTLKARYGYDGHDQLVYSSNDNSRQQRRYLGYEMDSVLEDGLLTQYLHTGGQPRAEFQLDVAEQNAVGPVTFLLTDHTGSVICESEEQTTRYACYAPYGEQLPEDSAQELRSLLAFNGEARERALGWLGWLGWYLLGLGYRAYNPRLMRFHSPDSLPPEETGINPYSYALGNPVYWQDPTGHRGQPVTHGREAPLEIISDDKPKIPWYVWLGVAATAAIFVVSAIAMPWTAPATLGITAGYVAGGIGEVCIVSLAIDEGRSATLDIVHVVETEYLGLDLSAIRDGSGGVFRAVILRQTAKFVVLECFVTNTPPTAFQCTRMQHVIVLPYLCESLLLAVYTQRAADFSS